MSQTLERDSLVWVRRGREGFLARFKHHVCLAGLDYLSVLEVDEAGRGLRLHLVRPAGVKLIAAKK